MKIFLKIRKVENAWIFDDEKMGIEAEPFVVGSSELIDFVKDLNGLNGRKELTLIASDTKFDNCEATEIVCHDPHTNWTQYHFDGFGGHLLCPVLLQYFSSPPPKIYFNVM